MSKLTFQRISNATSREVPGNLYRAITVATLRTLDHYERIVDLDAQNTEPKKIITRHLGAIAVVHKPAASGWRERVSGLMLFGEEQLFEDSELPTLFLTKALQRAVRAEEKGSDLTEGNLPPYEYLGLSTSRFSVGIAGPYPYHTELLLSQFTGCMVEHLDNGHCQLNSQLDDDEIKLIEQGHKGGNDGDSGDNTPDMIAASLPFREFVEGVISR